MPPSAAPGGRPRGRPSRDAVHGRERILAAALDLFPRWGFATTRVEDIVTAAGVTTPVLYHHFGTKAGLYIAAAEHVYRIVLDRHEAILDDAASFAEVLGRMMDLAIVLRREQPLLAPMMLTVVIDIQRDPTLAERLNPIVRSFRRFFDRVAALAPEDLRPTPAAQRALSGALVTLMNGLDISSLLARTEADYVATVRALGSLLHDGANPPS